MKVGWEIFYAVREGFEAESSTLTGLESASKVDRGQTTGYKENFPRPRSALP
jgi:hypothetical protein